MKSDRPPSDISRRVLLSSMALLPALSGMPVTATAQQVSGFSFAVYGDSRPMMYLPYKEGSPTLPSCSSKCSAWSCRRRSRKRW